MKSRHSLLLGVGVLFLTLTTCWADTHYVARNGQIPAPNYLTWETAASNIQDAVNVAVANETVLVTNGTYTLTNQITLNAAINLRSVNGASWTFINGNYPQTTNRCVYINNNTSVVDGFTITNGPAYPFNRSYDKLPA